MKKETNMKYIDAEKLKERIEKLDMESCIPDKWDGFYYAIDSVLEVITSLQQEQPSLPSNLDEAADAYSENILANGEDMFDAIADGFRAGAEWMAGKGVIIEGEVVSTDENRTSIRYTTPCYPTYHDYIYIKPIDCTKGDKVVVQIRKK